MEVIGAHGKNDRCVDRLDYTRIVIIENIENIFNSLATKRRQNKQVITQILKSSCSEREESNAQGAMDHTTETRLVQEKGGQAKMLLKFPLQALQFSAC